MWVHLAPSPGIGAQTSPDSNEQAPASWSAVQPSVAEPNASFLAPLLPLLLLGPTKPPNHQTAKSHHEYRSELNDDTARHFAMFVMRFFRFPSQPQMSRDSLSSTNSIKQVHFRNRCMPQRIFQSTSNQSGRPCPKSVNQGPNPLIFPFSYTPSPRKLFRRRRSLAWTGRWGADRAACALLRAFEASCNRRPFWLQLN